MKYDTKIQVDYKMRGMACEVKTLNEQGVFAGYASVFNIVDSQRDIILPGAFVSTLKERAGQIKLLWQHDQKDPIGIIEELREDVSGLYIRGRLMLDLARGREAYALLKQGIVSGLSIGYSPTRFRVDPDTGVRILGGVDLWEVSLVTFPANHAAQVTVFKHADGVEDAVLNDREWQQFQQAGHVMRMAHELERATRILRE